MKAEMVDIIIDEIKVGYLIFDEEIFTIESFNNLIKIFSYNIWVICKLRKIQNPKIKLNEFKPTKSEFKFICENSKTYKLMEK